MPGRGKATENWPAHRIALAREADFALGAAQVSPAAREIIFAGRRRVLQPRIMQVLVLLARNKDKVVSRDQLVTSCWGGLSVSEDAVQRAIARLRQFADESGEAPFRIETIARVGYRLTEHAADDPVPASPKIAHPQASAIPIAVLPFVNLSSELEQEYFSDGLSEELMNRLARTPGLRVAPRTSSFIFKGQAVDVKQVGETLGVTHVVEGCVRKSGQCLRISARLADSAEGYCLWSQTYDRQIDDVFAIYDEIAGAVSSALHAALGVAEPDGPAGTKPVVA
jgi:TolB-like protein